MDLKLTTELLNQITAALSRYDTVMKDLDAEMLREAVIRAVLDVYERHASRRRSRAWERVEALIEKYGDVP